MASSINSTRWNRNVASLPTPQAPAENAKAAEASEPAAKPASTVAAQFHTDSFESSPRAGASLAARNVAEVSGAAGGGVSVDQLQAIMPNLSREKAEEYLPHLNNAMAEAGINTPQRQAAFMAQLAHESGEFRYMEEIASGEDYEGRTDLGNTEPGDGVRFKGRGPIQLTGRNNYRAAGEALGIDLENNPKRAADPDVGFRTAAWFWNSRNLNDAADAGDFDTITRRINGGYNGKAERDAYHATAREVLGAGGPGQPSGGDRPLSLGMNGPRVTELQNKLKASGFDPGPVDGDFGFGTDRAVRAFQESRGLEADGVAGPATWGKLNEASAPPPPPAPEPGPVAGGPTLRVGANGPEVADLQNKLKGHGFDPGPVDGDFGPGTEAAVRAFQESRGLESDGVAGPATWGKLNETSAPPQPEQPQPPSGPTPVLRVGASGPEVRELQDLLNRSGASVDVDGEFGPGTERAVRSYQSSRGLDADGVAGPATWNALRSNAPAVERPTGPPGVDGISPQAREQMDRLLAYAEGNHNGGSRGRCYEWVSKYLEHSGGYGGFNNSGEWPVPSSHWAEARNFAEWMNEGDNAARAGLKRLDISNPYDAPPGSIVVVGPGSPGTRHPTAGDIAVATGQGRFVNDGPNMGYGDPASFEANGGRVLGVYVPA